VRLAERGVPIDQETRHWDEEEEETRPGRGKEESSDYRYFSEPDLVPIRVDAEWREQIGSTLPELPSARRQRLGDMGIDPVAARLLAADLDMAAVLEDAAAAGADPRAAANWLTGEVVANLRRSGRDLAATPLDGAALAALLGMIDAGELSSTAAKEVLAGVLDGEGSPAEVAAGRDLIQIGDTGDIEAAVDRALAAHPAELERMRGGEDRLVGFFVGQVMRETGGRADPRIVGDLVRQKASG
jgi:aspartyl-tRNA(Asn)/glutamyl-tRNA(Gln) amidotransferase subunit B